MDKQNVVFPNNGLLLGKGQIIYSCNNMNICQKCYTKWKQSFTKDCMIFCNSNFYKRPIYRYANLINDRSWR